MQERAEVVGMNPCNSCGKQFHEDGGGSCGWCEKWQYDAQMETGA